MAVRADYDPETLTPEQKKPAITVRARGQEVAQAEPLESYFSDLPPAGAATPKPGQKPIEDYFKDLGVPETGPVNPKAVVVPPTVSNPKLFEPEEGVDYETGAPMGHRMNLYRASSDKGPDGKNEQETYLEKSFGKGNYRQGPGGEWLVKPNWEKFRDRNYSGTLANGPAERHDQAKAPWTAVYPRGVAGTMENIGVGVAAPALTAGGAMLGGVAGTAMGGPPGGVAGAVIGGGGGSAVDEALKAFQGFHNKTPLDTAKHIGVDAAVGGAFQGAPWMWNATRQGVYNLTSNAIRRFTGVTPETQALTHSLEPYGVTPPVESIAPNAKMLAWDRKQRNLTSGDPMAAERRAVIDQRIGEVFDSTGMSPVERANAVQYVNDVSTAPGSGRTGQIVRDALTTRNEQSQLLQDAYVEDAHRALDRALGTYTRNIFSPPVGKAKRSAVDMAGDTARGVTHDIEGARETFGQEMNLVADAVHGTFGARPVVDISQTIPLVEDFMHPMPGPMRQIMKKAGGNEGQGLLPPALPPDNVAPDATIDEIKAVMQWMQEKSHAGAPPASTGMPPAANENGPILVTVKDAHALRSSLMEMVRLKGDTSPIGVRRHEVLQIVHAIDAALDQVGLEAGGSVGQMMRGFNQRWADGIVRFTNDDINAILRQTRAGRPPDAGVVADAIMNRKSLTATKQVYDMLSPDMQHAVKTADLQNIISEATLPVGRFGRPTLDPDALLEALAERTSLHRFMYGRNEPIMKQLQELAVTFKAAGGQVELDSLPRFTGNVVPLGRSPVGVSNAVFDIRDALYRARDEQRRLAEEVQRDVIGSLRSNDPKLQDEGVRYVLKSEARTLRAAEVLGAWSPEWRTLQREAVVETLKNAVVPTLTGVGRTINARELENSLGQLTDRQQRMLFPGQLYDDIRLLARQAKMLFPELTESSGGGLAAGATLGNFPKANALRRYTWSQVAGFIADSPAVARVLAGTIRNDPYRGRKMLSYLMQYGVGAAKEYTNQAGGITEGSEAEPGFDEQMRRLDAVHKPVRKTGYGGPSID